MGPGAQREHEARVRSYTLNKHHGGTIHCKCHQVVIEDAPVRPRAGDGIKASATTGLVNSLAGQRIPTTYRMPAIEARFQSASPRLQGSQLWNLRRIKQREMRGRRPLQPFSLCLSQSVYPEERGILNPRATVVSSARDYWRMDRLGLRACESRHAG